MIIIKNILYFIRITGWCQGIDARLMRYGAIQVLRNADGGGGVSDFPEKSVTKV